MPWAYLRAIQSQILCPLGYSGAKSEINLKTSTSPYCKRESLLAPDETQAMHSICPPYAYSAL